MCFRSSDTVTVDERIATSDTKSTAQHAHCCRFASSIRSEEGKNLPFTYLRRGLGLKTKIRKKRIYSCRTWKEMFLTAAVPSGYTWVSPSSGVYICKSIVNDLRHGNYICKSEVIYLSYEYRITIPVEFTYVNQ